MTISNSIRCTHIHCSEQTIRTEAPETGCGFKGGMARPAEARLVSSPQSADDESHIIYSDALADLGSSAAPATLPLLNRGRSLDVGESGQSAPDELHY